MGEDVDIPNPRRQFVEGEGSVRVSDGTGRAAVLQQAQVGLETPFTDFPGTDSVLHGAARFTGMPAIVETARGGGIGKLGKTRREFVAPATHYASAHENLDYPRMGERIRLKADFDVSRFAPDVQAILKGLKKYGMFVADNGIDWAISVAPDPRIPNMHAELRKVKGSAFEVVVAPQ